MRPRLTLPTGVLIAQVIKRYARGGCGQWNDGSCAAVRRRWQAMLAATQGKETAVINTAYIERLNATFRARLAPLVRRSRARVRQVGDAGGGMWLVGTL